METGILKICKYGDDVLKVKAREIRDIDRHITDLAAAMVQTMQQAPGIGLAAPQVNESLQLLTVDLSVGENPEELLIMINPQIIEADGYRDQRRGLPVGARLFPAHQAQRPDHAASHTARRPRAAR